MHRDNAQAMPSENVFFSVTIGWAFMTGVAFVGINDDNSSRNGRAKELVG
jgi:hypothetical protein